MLGPLGLLALVYGRKKKGNKAGMLLVLLLVGVSMGVTLAACGNGPTEFTVTVQPLQTPIPTQLVTIDTPNAPPTSIIVPVSPTTTLDYLCDSIIPANGDPFDPARWNETIYTVEARKNTFLQAVLRHQSEMPQGMTLPLMLAMGSAEKGVCSDWSQVNDPCNPGNADGILQLSPDNEFRYASGYPYNDTYGGFEGNVRDATLYLNEISKNYHRQGIDDHFTNIPSSASVKLLLYFNGGGNPILTYAGLNKDQNGNVVKGNPKYLHDVAQYLMDSPFGCQYNDVQLASDLLSAQDIVDRRIKEVLSIPNP